MTGQLNKNTYTHRYIWASKAVLVVKNLPASVGDVERWVQSLSQKDCPEGGNGNPL